MGEDEIAERIKRLEIPFNAFGLDPYGISRRHLHTFYAVLGALYRQYFRVQAHGVANVPPRGRAMLVGNHSGGFAIDGMMVIASMFLELEPPRVAQGMAERFLNRHAVASLWTSRTGQFTGLPEHAVRLLEDERLLMVFPEGARGTAKLYTERYSLLDFGTGFLRLALKTKTPIIPFAFLGGGAAVPTVTNLYKLGRLMGVPYIPVTPWGLPLPLPVKLDVIYGEPMRFAGSGDEEDEVIAQQVGQVKARIGALIEIGRKVRKERR